MYVAALQLRLPSAGIWRLDWHWLIGSQLSPLQEECQEQEREHPSLFLAFFLDFSSREAGIQLPSDKMSYPSRMESSNPLTQTHIPAEGNPVTRWHNAVSQQKGIQLPSDKTPYPSRMESSYPVTQRHIPAKWNPVTRWHKSISQQKGIQLPSDTTPYPSRRKFSFRLLCFLHAITYSALIS